MYELLRKLHFENRLGYFTRMTQAGGKLSEDTQMYFSQYAASQGIDFYIMYGQTEATARMSYLPPRLCMTKPGSAGQAIPGGKFTIVNECGESIINSHEQGEIVYQGENVSYGYSDNFKDLCKGDENNGRLFTGDTGYFDDDGMLYIIGRKNRYIKISGSRINLDELENRLSSGLSSTIVCVACGEKIILNSLQSDECDANEAVQLASRLTRLPGMCFKHVVLREIPYTKNGKMDYAKLTDK